MQYAIATVSVVLALIYLGFYAWQIRDPAFFLIVLVGVVLMLVNAAKELKQSQTNSSNKS